MVTSWTGGGGTGAYTLVMTGVCFSGGRGNVCGAADVGGVGGVQGADNHLDNNDFVVFIDLFFGHSPLADQGDQGLSVDELHGVEVDAPLAADKVDGHDVRVVQAGRRLRLVLEA